MLDNLEGQFFESLTIRCDRETEDAFVERWFPGGILIGRAPSLADLREFLADVDQRWRLDAILVIRDLAEPA